MPYQGEKTVVIESAPIDNPHLFSPLLEEQNFYGVESALEWIEKNREILNTTRKVFRIRRLIDSTIWDQQYIEINIRN